jgi:hypothetical protein
MIDSRWRLAIFVWRLMVYRIDIVWVDLLKCRVEQLIQVNELNAKEST